MRLSAKRRENLTKLADYLDTLPEDYQHFTMSTFIDNEGEMEPINQYAEKNGGVGECGAVACAIGHGPAAGILFPRRRSNSPLWYYSLLSRQFTPHWEAYSARFLICEEKYPAEWEWCFGADWSNTDNHPWGAAARIRYLLAGKDIPEAFDSDWAGPEEVQLYSEFRKK